MKIIILDDLGSAAFLDIPQYLLINLFLII